MTSQRLPYVRGLDGLRALAILSVLAFHLQITGAMLGWAGVQLFFVISGFLITRILLVTRNDEHPFRSFYIRRALRIFPIYYLFLFAVVLVHVGNRFDRLEYLPFYLTYTQNVAPDVISQGLYATTHTWSLAVEEQFYLLWPAAVLILPLHRLKWSVPILMLAAPLWRFSVIALGADPAYSTGALPSQVDSLAIGAAIAVALHLGLRAVVLRRVAWIAIGMGGLGVAVIVSAIGPESFWDYRNWVSAGPGFLLLSAVAILSGGVVALVVAGSTPGILEWRPFVWTGRVSYGIYIYHGLAFYLIEVNLDGFLAPLAATPMGGLLIMAVKLALTWAMTVASWRFVEAPMLNLKDRFAPPRPNVDPLPTDLVAEER